MIDTGIDYTHPALGGGFGPGFKVAYGRDFVGDAFRPGGPSASPDNDPVSTNETSRTAACARTLEIRNSPMDQTSLPAAMPAARLGPAYVTPCL